MAREYSYKVYYSDEKLACYEDRLSTITEAKKRAKEVLNCLDKGSIAYVYRRYKNGEIGSPFYTIRRDD